MNITSQSISTAQNLANAPRNSPVAFQGPAQPTRAQSNGPSPLLDKTLGELSSDDFDQLGADSSLQSLANLQADLTLGEVAPLLRNPIALDSIIELMEQRPDLKVGDFVSRDINGGVSIDPSYKNGETMDFLKERPDISPQEVTSMRAEFTRLFRDPMMGKWATEMGFDLMRQRPDLKPQDMTRMMDSFARAAGLGDKSKGGSGPGGGSAMAALDMFSSASRLLVKREDMSPQRLGKLAESVGSLASPDDPNRGQRVAEGFDGAISALEKNPLREPEEFSKLAGVIGSHFKGKDENSAAIRMNAFSQSARMMGENSEISPDSIDSVLSSAKSRNPKKNQPRALGNALTGVFEGVQSGLVGGSNLTGALRAAPKLKTTRDSGRQREGQQEQNELTQAGPENRAVGERSANFATPN